MRTLIVCLLAASAAVPAAAQVTDPPYVVVPRGLFTSNGHECRLALIAAQDHAGDALVNAWPTLWVEADDRRWPLDCEATFRALGIPDHRLMRGGESLNISRPRFTSETTATVLIDASLGLRAVSRTRYTLALEDGQWRVTGRTEIPVTAGAYGMT